MLGHTIRLQSQNSLRYSLTCRLISVDVLAADDAEQEKHGPNGAVYLQSLEDRVEHYWNPTSPSISSVSAVTASAKPVRKSPDSRRVFTYRST